MTAEEANEYANRELIRALKELRDATKSAVRRTGLRAPEEMYEGLRKLTEMVNGNEREKSVTKPEKE